MPDSAQQPIDLDIRRRIDACPKLASLQSNNQALRALVSSEASLTSQIAEIIRRDPSLSARLLRMVNSVYYGLSAQVNTIEEAVFFLGLRQIRELSLATPIIEDIERLQNSLAAPLPWRNLWTHSIATAILTREVLRATSMAVDDDTDYLSGLLHNVGKIVMAYAFPDELQEVVTYEAPSVAAVCEHERKLVGWDHAEIGAYYLERHRVSAEIVFAVRYHARPEMAPSHGIFAAAVQVADQLARHSGIDGGFEKVPPIEADAWLGLEGWRMLHGVDGTEAALARASVANALRRLPTILGGLQ
jgi:HD-like signal output (HDOD) protein